MRISMIGPTYPFRGGIAHYTTLLYRALRERHDVCFVSFLRQYPNWLFPGTTDRDPSQAPVVTNDVHYQLDSLNPLSWRRSAETLVGHRPELVIFQWWVAFWAPHFRWLSRYIHKHSEAQVIFLCHNAVEHESHPLKRAATRWVLSGADHIFTHAEAETLRLRQLLGDGAQVSTAFLPTYADLTSGPLERDEALRRLALPWDARQTPVLLFFGFIRPYKGLDILLTALPSVLERIAVRLLVVGEFWAGKDETLQLTQQLGLSDHVHVVDRYVANEEIAEWFAIADLVVQPYRSASGSAICQLAYGHAKPVIATAVGSLSEVVIDGENGRLVPPEDSQALADAIVDSLEPSTLLHLDHGAASTKERFSWSALVDILTRQA